MNKELINKIHACVICSENRKMVALINEYGLYDFWEDYNTFLSNAYKSAGTKHDYFLSATVRYFRITNR